MMSGKIYSLLKLISKRMGLLGAYLNYKLSYHVQLIYEHVT